MTYTISKGLRDREHSKFTSLDAGSQVVVSVNLNNNVKVYEFPAGSLAAWDEGDISGGNFHSFTHHPLNGLLYGIQWLNGNNTAAGSLAIKMSGAGAMDIWSTITRATTADFTIFPRGAIVSTTDEAIDLSSGCCGLIPLSGIYQVIGSDIGIGLGFSGLRIAYI